MRVAAALLALLIAAPATAAEPAKSTKRDCFWANQVSGFTEAGKDRVIVNMGVSQAYALELAGVCPDVDWATRIGIVSHTGSNRICSGLDADLIVPGIGGSRLDRCPVRTVRKLTPEEAAAHRGGRRKDETR